MENGKHPLTEYRERHALRKSDLARLLGVDRANITRWEKGHRVVALKMVRTISQKLGIPPQELRKDLADLTS